MLMMLCKICKKVFSSQGDFLRHCRDAHKTEDGVPRFTCTFDNICGRQFSNADSFRRHLRAHRVTGPAQPLEPFQQPSNRSLKPPNPSLQPFDLSQESGSFQSSLSFIPSINEEEDSDDDDVREDFRETFKPSDSHTE